MAQFELLVNRGSQVVDTKKIKFVQQLLVQASNTKFHQHSCSNGTCRQADSRADTLIMRSFHTLPFPKHIEQRKCYVFPFFSAI